MECSRGWIILLALALLWGCASMGEPVNPDRDIANLQRQVYKIQQERDSLSHQLASFRKEVKNDISALRDDLASFQKESRMNTSTLKKEKESLGNELATFQKEARNDISTLRNEGDLLKSDLSRGLEALESRLNTVQQEKESLKNEFSVFQKEARNDISALRNEGDLLKSDLSRRLEALQSRLNLVQKEEESRKSELDAFQKDVRSDSSALKKEVQLLKTGLATEVKSLQADIVSQKGTLQNEMKVLSSAVEEYKEFLKKPSQEMDRLKEDIAFRMRILEEKRKILEEKSETQSRNLEERLKGLEGRGEKNETQARALEERLKGLEGRGEKNETQARALEERLKGLEGRIDRIASKQEELGKPIPAKVSPAEMKEPFPVTGPGDLYKDAYQAFQKGDLEGARKKFEAFLKQYPSTGLSDNAHFWIGETYFLQRDYERAILEYEKTIVKDPEGDKVSAALFKQALAFFELGDKTNAKNLFQRVIDRFPDSREAEMARRRLEGIK